MSDESLAVKEAQVFIATIADIIKAEDWSQAAIPADILETYTNGRPIKDVGIFRPLSALKKYNVPEALLENPLVRAHTIGIAFPCQSGWVIRCCDDCVVVLLLHDNASFKLKPFSVNDSGLGFDDSDVPDDDIVNGDKYAFTTAIFTELKAADTIEVWFQGISLKEAKKVNSKTLLN